MASALLVSSQAAGAGTTCPADEPCVTVTVVGETSQTTEEFSLADFDSATGVRTNQTYDYKGSPSANYPSLLPVRDLLDQLGTPPAAVSFIELGASTAAPGSVLTADNDDLDDPGPFKDGQVPAIYTVKGSDGQRFGYTRGQRSSDDSNGDDTISTSGNLILTVHIDGKPLRPVVTATPQSQTTTNKPVTFSVNVEQAPGRRYTWSFGDGTTLDDTTEATPAHQYTRTTSTGQDSFTARVTVTGTDSSAGSSRPVTVTIGTATPGDGTRPGTGQDPSDDAPATGPNKSKGDRQGSKPSDTPGGTGSGTGDGASASSGTPGRAAPDAQAPDAADAPQAAAVPEAQQQTDGLVSVDGILLGQIDSSGQVVPTAEQVAAARTAAAARQAASRRTDLSRGALLGLLALLGLVGAGAVSETPWWQQRVTQLVGRVRR